MADGMKMSDGERLNFIDLFAGCGGLSEGFYKEGFNALAHVEIEPKACMTLRSRMKYYGYTNSDKAVLNIDITSDDVIDKLENAIDKETVHDFSVLYDAFDSNGIGVYEEE